MADKAKARVQNKKDNRKEDKKEEKKEPESEKMEVESNDNNQLE